MRRRDLLALFAASPALQRSAVAQSKQIDYRQYAQCLPDYLRAQAKQAYESRNAALAQLKTPAQIRQRQAWVRETFWKLTGGEPKKTPLNLRTTGELKRPEYRIEKLVYESQPGVLVAANLYVPTSGAGPFPAVLFQAGHSPNGKAGDTYQRCCQGLARLGYVVLSFDPMGQGERTNYPGPTGMTRLATVDDEHTVPGRQMLLVGDTATRMQAWDAVRSLDVLAAHPKVDARRLASTGQSGGGTLTMILCAIDDRLHTAAVSSGNTENLACANFLPPGSTDDAEQNFIGAGPLGFDRWDLLWPFAPKPLLVLTSEKDFYGTYSPNYEQSGREEFGKLQEAYRRLSSEAMLEQAAFPLPHGLSYAPRLAIYNWMDRRLKDGPGNLKEEPPVNPEPDDQLWAAPNGNVRSLGGLSPLALVQKKAAQVPTPSGTPDLRKLLAISPTTGATLTIKDRAPSSGCEVQACEVASAPQVWAPAWLFIPRRPQAQTLLLLDPAGRNTHWREGGLCHQLAAEGITVCAADVRGIGDLQPEFTNGAPAYTRDHQSEENYAWASLILGQSLLGQRVQDILALVRSLPATRLSIAASGSMTISALCAAVLEPRIQSLFLTRHLITWRSLTEAEDYSHSFANFVPDILRHTDLPQLAARLAPRRLTLAGVLDAAGTKADPDRVRREYAGANPQILDIHDWSAPALLSFCRETG